MIEKIKRKRVMSKQDITKPKSIEELIQKYDLENENIYSFLDNLVEYLNSKGV